MTTGTAPGGNFAIATRTESVTSEDLLGLLRGGSAFNLPFIDSQAQLDSILQHIPSYANLANGDEPSKTNGLPRNPSLDFLLQFAKKDVLPPPGSVENSNVRLQQEVQPQCELGLVPTTSMNRTLSTQKGASSAPSSEDDKEHDRRKRRKLSNRESARRSRKRKQEHLSLLESRVAELESETKGLRSLAHSLTSQLAAKEKEVFFLKEENSRLKNNNAALP